MSIYVPTTFGLLIKVGDKERTHCRKSTENVGVEENGGGTIYFNLFIWELEKQLELQLSKRSHNPAEEEGRTSPNFAWLEESGSARHGMTPILYHLVERKCNELLPKYAENALKKFKSAIFDSVMAEDIPWTLLAILREEKEKQEKEYVADKMPTSSIFERVDNWLSWRQRSRRRQARIAPEVDVEAGTSRPPLVSKTRASSPGEEIMMTTTRNETKPPSTHEFSEGGSISNEFPPISGKRSFLNFKRKEFPLRKISSATKYEVLPDDGEPKSSDDPSTVAKGTDTANQTVDDRSSDQKKDGRITRSHSSSSKFQQLKGGLLSALSNVRPPGNRSRGHLPLHHFQNP